MKKTFRRSERGNIVMTCTWDVGLLHYNAFTKHRNMFRMYGRTYYYLKRKNMNNAILIMYNVSLHRCEEIRTFVEVNGYAQSILHSYLIYVFTMENYRNDSKNQQ